jgi:hypothetical protein
MRTLLTTAIEEKRLIHLLYDGKSRTVEPYLLGKNNKQEDVFLGRQISPWTPMEQSWQIFRLPKIYGLLVLDTHFKGPLELIELPANVLSGIRLMV